MNRRIIVLIILITLSVVSCQPVIEEEKLIYRFTGDFNPSSITSITLNEVNIFLSTSYDELYNALPFKGALTPDKLWCSCVKEGNSIFWISEEKKVPLHVSLISEYKGEDEDIEVGLYRVKELRFPTKELSFSINNAITSDTTFAEILEIVITPDEIQEYIEYINLIWNNSNYYVMVTFNKTGISDILIRK